MQVCIFCASASPVANLALEHLVLSTANSSKY